MDTIEFNGVEYPSFQADGFSAQYIHPIAKKVCKGYGYDIGCGKKEWILPGSAGIDPLLNDKDFYSATNLPMGKVDYIFSSHCLEHLDDWVGVLDYWTEKLQLNGVLFLYLPHYDQEYWRPWNNRKHKHIFTPEIIKDYMSIRYTNIFCSGRDLNHSFAIMGEKDV